MLKILIRLLLLQNFQQICYKKFLQQTIVYRSKRTLGFIDHMQTVDNTPAVDQFKLNIAIGCCKR